MTPKSTRLVRPAFLNLIPLALGAIAKEEAEVVEGAAKVPEPGPTTRQQRRRLARSEAKARRGGRG